MTPAGIHDSAYGGLVGHGFPGYPSPSLPPYLPLADQLPGNPYGAVCLAPGRSLADIHVVVPRIILARKGSRGTGIRLERSVLSDRVLLRCRR